MAKKFEKTVNYLIVTDTDTSIVEIERPSKDVYFRDSNDTIKFYDAYQHQLLGKGGYPFGLTAAEGSVELTGGSAGSVDSITVNAVTITSGAESYDTDLDTTASNVADNINAHTSTPNYTASASGATITITSVTKGTAVNTYAVVSTTTTITSTDTNMAGATADIEDSSDTPFADKAALLTFLRTNTGS